MYKLALFLSFLITIVSCQSRKEQLTQASTYIRDFSRYTVVIDPGHGGKDGGTHSLGKELHEKNLTLATALMLREHLIKKGFKVILTRDKDVFISLNQRSIIANQIRSHIFVSIHFNSASNRQAQGVEVFYMPDSTIKHRSKQSKELATLVLQNIIYYTHANSRGVKDRGFSVIRKTWMPAILVEGGFLTNSQEQQKLANQTYLNFISLGIAKGIEEYFN